MVLNYIGKIVQKFWLEIPDHFDNVELDEFSILPDHMHGIVRIKNHVPTALKSIPNNPMLEA